MAKKILRDAGQKFVTTSQIDRAEACEEYVQAILVNSDWFVAAHLTKDVESLCRTVVGVQTMIGAPKKRAEGHELNPMETLSEWLNQTS